jgi:long-chain fatty acid transport protein
MIFKKVWIARILRFTSFSFFLLPSLSYASFIESTIGTAVVNDATASYYNPAALVFVKNIQIIPQGTIASFHTRFTGQSTPVSTGITESGSSVANTNYLSPSLFLGMPINDRVIIGLAIVTGSANKGADDNSILRYVQPSSDTQDYDIVPAIALKINEIFSIGAGVDFSYVSFDSKPIVGFPGSNIADSQAQNTSDGTGVGGNVGFLLKPGPATVIGFNYRSMTSYQLSGTSNYDGPPQVVSNDYHFKLSTPARSVLSINHFFTPKLGFIGTVQRIQWSSLTTVNVFGIAGASGTTPVIVNGTIPYYLQDTWSFTLGGHYRITPKWIVRIAGSYNQSPGNPNYQLTNGDNIVLGASMGYVINKTVSIDGSYAHAFMKDETIDINGAKFVTQGVNTGARDGVSLKLTFNL